MGRHVLATERQQVRAARDAIVDHWNVQTPPSGEPWAAQLGQEDEAERIVWALLDDNDAAEAMRNLLSAR